MNWTMLHPNAYQLIGMIPDMLSEDDPRPAREQIDENYAHGGGWNPMKGWTMELDRSIIYPDDPPYRPVAQVKLREETILVYEHAWVAIVQPGGEFEISRMD